MNERVESNNVGVRSIGIRSISLLFALVSVSCAVPVPPTGGPTDETPPALIDQIPADGSVQFDGRDLYFEFDEHVDRTSFQRAFSIMPDVEGTPEFDWSGRSVRVRLPAGLRPETTYIVTLDNQLRDARNVALTAPISVAFSTGSSIDQGELAGNVLEFATGQAASGVDVYLYTDSANGTGGTDDPNSASAADSSPLYRTQTGATGAFQFSHLAPGEYLVVAVRDINRNRLIDPAERYAVPPVPSLRVDSLLVRPDAPWILATHDDNQPTADGAQAVSRRDIELRFSEMVRRIVGGNLILVDSTTARPSQIRSVYTLPSSPRNIYLDTPPLTPGTWRLSGQPPAADSSGNPALEVDLTFRVPTEPGNRVVEWMSFQPDSTGLGADSTAVLWLGQRPGFELSRPISLEMAISAVSVRDTTGAVLDAALLPELEADIAATRFVIDPGIEVGVPFDVTVDLGAGLAGAEQADAEYVEMATDSTFIRRFMIATADMTGEISGFVERPEADEQDQARPGEPAAQPTAGPVIVEILRSGQNTPVTRVLTQGGAFLATGLPGGFRFRLRAFVDADGDGEWSPGSLDPWTAPEPVLWFEGAEAVRARWETAIPDTLRFGRAPDNRQ